MTTTLPFEHERAEGTREGRFDLPRDATLRLRASDGALVLRAEAGTVLVTREGDADDHVLERGAELRVAGPGLVVAWALDRARLDVRRTARTVEHAAWGARGAA